MLSVSKTRKEFTASYETFKNETPMGDLWRVWEKDQPWKEEIKKACKDGFLTIYQAPENNCRHFYADNFRVEVPSRKKILGIIAHLQAEKDGPLWVDLYNGGMCLWLSRGAFLDYKHLKENGVI